MLPKLLECWDVSDDWTGVTDARERRKRQNRLHQRTYRNKKNLKRLRINDSTALHSNSDANSAHMVGTRGLNAAAHVATFYLLQDTDIPEKAARFLQTAYLNWSVSRPIRSDLSTLSRLNAFDALARNAFILQIPVECLADDDGQSPFFGRHGTLPHYPAHLSPTVLQTTVRHHPWLDLLPFPRLRDNILMSLQANTLDEDELSQEIVCELLNFSGAGTASLMIWGDSWDMGGWECQVDFLKKWPFLMEGCEDMRKASKHWETKREAVQLERN